MLSAPKKRAKALSVRRWAWGLGVGLGHSHSVHVTRPPTRWQSHDSSLSSTECPRYGSWWTTCTSFWGTGLRWIMSIVLSTPEHVQRLRKCALVVCIDDWPFRCHGTPSATIWWACFHLFQHCLDNFDCTHREKLWPVESALLYLQGCLWNHIWCALETYVKQTAGSWAEFLHCLWFQKGLTVEVWEHALIGLSWRN